MLSFKKLLVICGNSCYWYIDCMSSESESHSVVSNSLQSHTVHGILQARVLEWVAVPSSRGSSQPRDRTQVSCIAGGFFTSWATREALKQREAQMSSDLIIFFSFLVSQTVLYHLYKFMFWDKFCFIPFQFTCLLQRNGANWAGWEFQYNTEQGWWWWTFFLS